MATVQTGRFCRYCGRQTLHTRATMGCLLGCFLTILTGGLFLPVWILIDLCNLLTRYRCQTCGSKAPPSLAGIVLALLIFALWTCAIAVVVYHRIYKVR